MSGRKRPPFGPIHSSSRPSTARTPSSIRIWSLPGFSTLRRERSDQRHDRHDDDDQHHHHQVVRDHRVFRRKVKAHRLERRLHERPEQGVHEIDDPERVFELFHHTLVALRAPRAREPRRSVAYFFNRRRRASTEAAATTEDAPTSSPTGCRRKRAIITYARTASKAYRPASFVTVQAEPRRAPLCPDRSSRASSPWAASHPVHQAVHAGRDRPVADRDQQPAAQDPQRRPRPRRARSPARPPP